MKKILTVLVFLVSVFANAQNYTITGIVKNTENNPIKNAVITLFTIEEDKTVFSDTAGKFELMANIIFLGNRLEIKDTVKDRSIRLKLSESMNNLDIDSGYIKIYHLTITKKSEGTNNNPPVFNSPAIVKKPVIYLYPEQKETVRVTVNFKGALTVTYPLYKNGWTVEAHPDGHLINAEDGKMYYYLFWDGKFKYDKAHLKFDDGFVVKQNGALTFLQNTLTQIGLNDKEQNDFIVFWLPELQKHPYTFVHFRLNEECEYISSNLVIPAPVSQLRLIMEFKPVSKNIYIRPQVIPSFKREGFVLVEWGGAEIKDEIIAGNQKL